MKQKKQTSPDESIFKDRDKDKETKFWEENFNKTFAFGKSVKVKFAKNLSESIQLDWDKIWKNIKRARAIKGKGSQSAAEFLEQDRQSH